jgi:hypothetical protein
MADPIGIKRPTEADRVHSTRMLTKLELVNRTQAAILAREARLYD